MKKLTLEATDENVLNSIRNNTYNRRDDIKDFVESLDMIEGNTFISLDARWGEGKTFYVRQIEKTLEYAVKKKWGDPEDITELKPYFEKTKLDTIDLKQSYLPIYYNSWLYDNHTDPLMSLLYVIVKKCAQKFDTGIKKKSIKDKLCALMSSISVKYEDVEVSVDVEKIKSAFSKDDILDEILVAEEIRNLVKSIFDEVIVENVDKLIIFIDELDRCRPSYAIEMLERIKHYFDDDRIIFIVSVNKEQLIHTISKYYGVGFDSTGYLNKFFDLNVHMPTIEQSRLFDLHKSEQFCLASMCDGLNEYYKLTIRDSLIFKLRMSDIPSKYANDHSAQGCCISMFVPIIAVLDILNVQEKSKFLNGKSDALKILSENIPEFHRIICRFGSRDVSDEDQYMEGFGKIKEVYGYAFGKKDIYPRLDVGTNIKEICMKICNDFRK